MWVPGLLDDLMVYVFKLYVGVSVTAGVSYKPSRLIDKTQIWLGTQILPPSLRNCRRMSNLFNRLDLGLGQDGLVVGEVSLGRLGDDLLHRRGPH